MRALRVDKLTYAALEATLVEHLAGRATDTVPAIRMATMPVEAIAGGRRRWPRRCGVRASARKSSTECPRSAAAARREARCPLVSSPLSIEGLSADALESRLRALDPPIVARIQDDRVVLDLRTIEPSQDEAFAHTLARVVPRL